LVSRPDWIPDRGEVVWLDFDPQTGTEQAGRRPAIVLSPASYNSRSGLALFCPITRQVKGYPFEVALPEGLDIVGVVLSDQVRSLDWRRRNAQPATVLPKEAIEEVMQKVGLLLAI
jgi:mRNA interferase MazF